MFLSRIWGPILVVLLFLIGLSAGMPDERVIQANEVEAIRAGVPLSQIDSIDKISGKYKMDNKMYGWDIFITHISDNKYNIKAPSGYWSWEGIVILNGDSFSGSVKSRRGAYSSRIEGTLRSDKIIDIKLICTDPGDAGRIDPHVLYPIELVEKRTVSVSEVQAKIEKRTVSASEVQAKIRAGEPAQYDDYTIEGALNLNALKIEGPVHFNYTIFQESVNFKSTTFNGPAYFIDSNFNGPADFTDSDFYGLADFTDSDFYGLAIFTDSDFYSDAYFGNSFYYYGVTFLRSAFNGYADFWYSTLNGGANFIGSVFNGYANFWSSTFNGPTIFGAAFNGGATFGKSNFTGDADFSNSNFNGTAFFDFSEFNGYAAFRSLEFNGDTDFWYSNFKGDTSFEGSEFNGDTDFWYSNFNGGANFIGSVFKGDTSFRGSEFNGTADFEGDTFDKEANFNEVVFKRYTSFNNSQFNGNTFFKDTTFESELSLTDTTYNKLIIRWHKIKQFVYDDAAYMSLMKNFKDLGYFEDYGSCYFQYRKEHRAQPWPGINDVEEWARKLIDYPLQWFYGYGTKPFNAFLWSLGIVIAFAFYWWFVGLGGPKDQTKATLPPGEDWPDGDITDILGFSVTVFLSGTKFFIDPPALPRIEGRSRSWIKIPFILERVLGALFSVLFFIAIGGTIVRSA